MSYSSSRRFTRTATCSSALRAIRSMSCPWRKAGSSSPFGARTTLNPSSRYFWATWRNRVRLLMASLLKSLGVRGLSNADVQERLATGECFQQDHRFTADTKTSANARPPDDGIDDQNVVLVNDPVQ